MFSAQEIYILRKENGLLKTANTKLKTSHFNQKIRADRLEKENKKLQEELKKTKDELEKMRKQRDTYKGMIFKPKVSKVVTITGEKKRLGGQLGHVGIGRKLPERINQTVRVFLKSCPDCHFPLKRSSTFDAHNVEDIPNLETLNSIVTQYKSERQWCSNCHKEVVGKPVMVIPHSRLGINLIIQILIFKYVCRMSLEILVETLHQSYGIRISGGGIVDILKRTKIYLVEDYGHLLKAIRSSPTKHADETGWRIAGINGWLWAFLTKTEVYYTIEETRGGGVARAVLEDSKETDVLIRDDYAGYKNLKMNQQSCWAHLLRKSKEEVTQKKPSKQMQTLHFGLKQMFKELEGIISSPFNEDLRQNQYRHYLTQLRRIIETNFRAKDARRIQTRIKNQGSNLLTALLHENVPLTNNAAERIIRPAVVVRKISGGSRSNIGAETFAVNFSVIQTIRMRNQALIPTLQTLLLNGAAGKL